MNLDSTDESDTKASEDFLEKMDDYQFISYAENHCINLQNSLGITEDELNEQGTKNPLLWEKSFEHEILLDVDDDFNLNFNDVCDSYIICLSQSTAEDVGFNVTADAVYKIENEHVGSDEDERIKTENINYEHNQEIHCSVYSDILDETKSNLEGNNCQDTAASISDEDQEELPYDGNLENGSGYNTDKRIDLAGQLPPLSNLVGSLSGQRSTGERSQNIPLGDQRSIVKNMFSIELNAKLDASSYHENKSEFGAFTSEQPVDMSIPGHGSKLENSFRLCGGRSNVVESGLHYFFEEDQALSSSKYIDSETLPEMSFTESIEETVMINHFSPNSNANSRNDLFIKNNTFSKSESDLSKMDGKLGMKQQLVQVKDDFHYHKFADVNGGKSSTCKTKTSCGSETPPKIIQEKNAQALLGSKTASEIAQNPTLKMGRTISCNEIKYGKGKQHYPQLDFSKIGPKVKIPKGNAYTNYNCPRLRLNKEKPSSSSSENPHAIHNSAVDGMQNKLDNAQFSVIATTEINSKKQHVEVNQIPEHFQQLQEEFDKLLIKYAEAENTIDQLRFGGKSTVLTRLHQHRAESACTTEAVTFFPLGLEECGPNWVDGASWWAWQSWAEEPVSVLYDSDSKKSTRDNCLMPLSVTSAGSISDICQSIPEVCKTTGEQMSQKLNKRIEYFKHQVEDFMNYFNSELVPVEAKQQELKELRNGQDKLERIYIATKDEYRNLQHRSYWEKDTTDGEFDPDREIEGEIFKIGMALENIKEKLDADICHQSSLHSSICTLSPLSIPELTSRFDVYSECPMKAITQEVSRDAQEGSLLNDASAKQNSFHLELMTKVNNNLLLWEDTNSHIPQRNTSFCGSMSYIKPIIHNGNEPSSLHNDENIPDVPSGCTTPFNWHKPTIGIADFPEKQGDAFLQLDLLTMYSDDHIPLPTPQQCIPRTSLQQTAGDTEENESLSKPRSVRNDKIIELQQEVAKLKQALEESLSKMSSDPRTKKSLESLSPNQSYSVRTCGTNKTSSIRSSPASCSGSFINCESMEHIKLTTNTLKDHKRGQSAWLQIDDDASDGELSNAMDFSNDTRPPIHTKQSLFETSRTAQHRQSYSGNYKSNGPGLESSCKEVFSERLTLKRKKQLSSISSTANKYSEIFTTISPARYLPISRVPRISCSPSYETIRTGLLCFPNQLSSTTYLWRNSVDKSISIPQISHLNAKLDRAIEATSKMKETTRGMLKSLSADLAKTEYCKYLYDF